MSDTYPIVDLSTATSSLAIEGRPEVDPHELATQLKDISDAIGPILADGSKNPQFGIKSIEIALSVGAEGGIWFVAKGSAEASIKLVLERPAE